MQVKFKALVKKVDKKALVSGDAGFSILLQGEDTRMANMIAMPSDEQIEIVANYNEK